VRRCERGERGLADPQDGEVAVNGLTATLRTVGGQTIFAATSKVSVVARNAGYDYDANGNMTTDGQFEYVWDNADRLKEVRKDGQVVMTCRYDGTLGGAGGIGGILSCSTSATSTVYYHYDANGNVIACTDADGIAITRLDYDPFGTVLVKSGNYTPRHQFSSKEWDQAAGVNYYGFRYYSPQTGRWLSRDPIEEMGGLNIYAFVLNNPVKDVDALGLAHFCCPDELAAVQAQYQQCVQGVIQDWRTCTANARTVRDAALTANQQAYDQMCQTIRNAGQQCRTGCQNQFPDQDFARSSCIFLCDTAEGTALNVAYGAYVAQRGTIWVTYAGLIAYCDVQKANRWEDCKNAGRAVCTNFSP